MDRGIMRAARINGHGGIREHFAFFGAPGEQMFGRAHLPSGSPTSGLVICPSLHAELLANYRREVLTARRLAGAGIAVQRFHYRGSGNSDGDTSALELGGLVEDALSAARELVDLTGVRDVGFLGTRLGAPVALAAAREWGAGPVVLWEPVVDAQSYFREIFRALRFRAVRQRENDVRSAQDLLAEMHREGHIDALGYPLHARLYDSLVGASIDEALADTVAPVLLVQMGGTRVRADYERLAEAATARGRLLQVELVAETEAWWLADDPTGNGDVTGSDELLDLTTTWLEATLAAPTREGAR